MRRLGVSIGQTGAAMDYYQKCLAQPKGRAALTYLRTKRGLSEEIITRFRLGFAPDDRGKLAQHLKAAGVSEADAMAAGLIRKSDYDDGFYDFFRNRVMFPLLDPEARCIAFGARTLTEDSGAKYLNSPESPVFRKSRSLYNLGPGGEAARKQGQLLVVEGYMDVIALAAGGFAHAAAPLGTAFAEPHLEMAWRAAPTLVLAFDGDEAGHRAMDRVIEMALPHVGPAHEMKFALLPANQDPDDLLREHGAKGVSEVFESALPLAEMIWRREAGPAEFSAPERITALQRRLNELAQRVGDEGVRKNYREFFKEQIYRRRRQGSQKAGGAVTGKVAVETKRAKIPTPNRDSSYKVRAQEALILQALFLHPVLLDDFAEALGRLQFNDPDLNAIRGELVSMAADGSFQDPAAESRRGAFGDRLGRRVATFRHLENVSFAKASAPSEEVRTGVKNLLEEYNCRQVTADGFKTAKEKISEDGADASVNDHVLTSVSAAKKIKRHQAEDFAAEQTAGAHEELTKMLEDRIWENS